jgi:hypothetical protein
MVAWVLGVGLPLTRGCPWAQGAGLMKDTMWGDGGHT